MFTIEVKVYCILRGSYFILIPWLAPNNTIRFFSWVVSFESCFKLTRCNLNPISREAEACILCSMLGRQRTPLLISKLHCFSCVYFGLFIILKETTNYANSTQKQPIQQISNGLFSVFFQRLLCSLCIFDKSSKSTDYASLCVICQQEMNGYLEIYSGLLYPLPSEDSHCERAGRAEVNNKEKKNQI